MLHAVLWVVMLLAATGCSLSLPAADFAFVNGYVYTADPEQSTAEAIAVRDGHILAVGSEQSIRRSIGAGTVVVDLDGRMVLPGLHDMHLHPLGVVPPGVCDLENEPLDLDELALRVADCMERYPVASPGQWLMVLEWNASRLRRGRKFATLREALDAVSTEHLIYLHASGGHHGAVNSVALARARNAAGEVVGYDAQTLQRDFADLRPLIAVDESGQPTGLLSEGARVPIGRPRLYGDVLGMDEIAAMLPDIVDVLAAAGITTAMEARTSPELLAVLAEFAAAGGLRIRLRTALYIDPHATPGSAWDALPGIMKQFAELRRRHAGVRLHVDAVKIFADGVLVGSPTSTPPQPPNAAVLEPYLWPQFATRASGALAVSGYGEDGESSRGVLRYAPDLLREFVRQATLANFHVHIHAIGDRAVRESVEAFAAVQPQARGRGLSQSLAHVELAHPDDQQRIGELGIAVVFTFSWATAEEARDLAVIPFIDRVSPGGGLYDPAHYYFREAYPAAGIKRHGGLLVGGSDAPVADRDPRPFTNIAAAVFRQGPSGVLNEAQRISIHDAIAAYTLNGAKMMGHADRLGSLEPGKVADLVVIDRNIVALAERGAMQEIAAAQVQLTMVDGEIVYQAAPGSADPHE